MAIVDISVILSSACSDTTKEHYVRMQFFRAPRDLKKYLSLFSPVNVSFIKFLNTKHLISTTSHCKKLHSVLYAKNHLHLFERANIFYLMVPTSCNESWAGQ